MTMDRCHFCGKPTRSHIYGDKVVCHVCFLANPEKCEKMRKQVASEEAEAVLRAAMAMRTIAVQQESSRQRRRLRVADSVELVDVFDEKEG